MSDALRALAERGTARLVPKGRRLITEGEFGTTIYVILGGRLRAFSSSADGAREVTYGEYGAGEYVGELSLDGGPRVADVEAVVTSWVVTVTRATLESVIAERPQLAFELLSKVIRRVRAATVGLRALALNDVYGRLVELLNERARTGSDGRRVAGHLTQREIARLIGCTPSMVSKVLKELVAGGYVVCQDHHFHLVKRAPSRY